MRLGSGLCILKDNNTQSQWRRLLNKNNSVFQAELLAILKEINFIHRLPSPVFIYSDSLSGLNAIAGFRSRSPMVHNIQKKLLNLDSTIQPILCWVPAHTGIFGNEFAEATAKEAAMATNLPEFSLPLPGSYLKKLTSIQLSQQQLRWDTFNTGRRTHKFVSKVSTNFLSSALALTTFLTGHGPFLTYLFRFGLSNNEQCKCGVTGTPDHYVFNCSLTSAFHLNRPADTFWKEWTNNLD
ncbi:uncharacterized protein LOC118180467 [Stegodyphus dumicola]|uniref:uncharacterized protein LOC118180467 n=1 Tax=Stegodyphus dumicola TaxID=202533 RepID=UPI0015AEB9F2|nr:uncharacterized protein LOC118180467 [Stegodyphus dumicola]